jgi:hypothetical protein
MSTTTLADVCATCGGAGDQQILQLFDDKCFGIVKGKDVSSDFCLKDFAYPLDGHSCVNKEVLPLSEVLLIDNDLFSPAEELNVKHVYAKGILLKIIYPEKDDNGEEIAFSDKQVKIILTDEETLTETAYPLYNFFSIFTNPKSINSDSLINKIKVYNNNADFSVRIDALILLSKPVA